MKETPTYKLFVTYLLLCIVWGSTWLAIKISLESFPPFFSAGLRFLIASITIYILMRIKDIQPQLNKGAIKLYIRMLFFSFVIPFGLVYWAEQFIESGLASVLFATYPFFVAIFASFSNTKEKISTSSIFGMLIGFSGIIIIFQDSFSIKISDYFWGMIAIVVSAMLQASVAVKIKSSGKFLNPFSMNLIPMFFAGLILIISGLLFEDMKKISITERGILSVLYLAIIGSVITFTSFYWLLKKVSVILMSLIAFITPIVAIFLGSFFYGEELSNEHLIGTILVLIGVLISTTSANSLGLKKWLKGNKI